VPTYWLTDARLSLANIKLASSGGELTIAAWGKNLMDRSYENTGFEAPGIFAPANFAVYGPPRTYGLSAQYNFH